MTFWFDQTGDLGWLALRYKPVQGFQGGTVGQTAVTKMEKIRHGFCHYSSYTFFPNVNLVSNNKTNKQILTYNWQTLLIPWPCLPIALTGYLYWDAKVYYPAHIRFAYKLFVAHCCILGQINFFERQFFFWMNRNSGERFTREIHVSS